MKRLSKFLSLSATLVVACFSINVTSAQVPEIANPNLPDIAMVTSDRFGRPVIIYNPIICRQAGPALCEFYKAHEYGHVNLGHTRTRQHPAEKEAHADCWAARHAPGYALRAAVQWFQSGGGASWHHGSGPERARRVIACSRGR